MLRISVGSMVNVFSVEVKMRNYLHLKGHRTITHFWGFLFFVNSLRNLVFGISVVHSTTAFHYYYFPYEDPIYCSLACHKFFFFSASN